MMNWKECVWKRLLPNAMYYLGICLEGLRKKPKKSVTIPSLWAEPKIKLRPSSVLWKRIEINKYIYIYPLEADSACSLC
jgi:hypothetical protein